MSKGGCCHDKILKINFQFHSFSIESQAKNLNTLTQQTLQNISVLCGMYNGMPYIWRSW
jgi:hypothetical protein